MEDGVSSPAGRGRVAKVDRKLTLPAEAGQTLPADDLIASRFASGGAMLLHVLVDEIVCVGVGFPYRGSSQKEGNINPSRIR